MAWRETYWFFYWLGGLHLASEQREDSYHFLVFTDLFGNRTHGVVVQYHRPVQVQHLPSPKRHPNSFVCHWLSAPSVLSGWCSPEWTQVEFIKVASLYPICSMHYLQIPLLQCSKGLFIMVGISVKSMALVYVRGHEPSTTRPIIHLGFLFYQADNCSYIENWIPGESSCLPGRTENPAGLRSLSDWVDDYWFRW